MTNWLSNPFSVPIPMKLPVFGHGDHSLELLFWSTNRFLALNCKKCKAQSGKHLIGLHDTTTITEETVVKLLELFKGHPDTCVEFLKLQDVRKVLTE